jgi:hypothetical protein
MTIVITDENGCLIDEQDFDTEDANEALRQLAEADTVSLEPGDRIQFRR